MYRFIFKKDLKKKFILKKDLNNLSENFQIKIKDGNFYLSVILDLTLNTKILSKFRTIKIYSTYQWHFHNL